MQSCLYEGRVWHERHSPVAHAFERRLCMVYLDLAELDRVFEGRWLWSTRRPAFAWFRRQDHLGEASRPLDECVRDLVEERSGRRPLGPIRILTHLRTAGYVINPVSLYYCYDEADSRVEAVVAEVTNTPWGERHCYVLDAASNRDAEGQIRLQSPKQLHVSPFMGMDCRYDWVLREPGDRLDLRIGNLDGEGALVFAAGMHLERREIDSRSLASALLRHPLSSLQILAGIYWQALLLYGKGAPFHSHPRARASEPSMETCP